MGIMAVVGMASAASAQKDQADQIGDARAAQAGQARQLIKQMNYKDAQLNQEDQNAYQQAQQQLENNSINAMRNRGMIEAAFAESGLEGRSVDSVIREVRGQDARTSDSIRADYMNQRRGVQSASEQNRMETVAAVTGQAKIRGPSSVSQTLQVINGGMQGANAGAAMGGAYSAATAPKGTTAPAKI
ncbi:putative internal virion protein B [Ralstonia phage RpT1]|nr:putative internal virion protein B [Ralstonia phage RpT1]